MPQIWQQKAGLRMDFHCGLSSLFEHCELTITSLISWLGLPFLILKIIMNEEESWVAACF